MPSHHRRRPAADMEEEEDTRPRRSSESQRRSQAISLNSFSTKRGHDRAIAEFKKRKETKFLKNATLLREYSKAMKSEGYDVGRGASRKRDRDGASDDKDFTGSKKQPQTEPNECKKRHKSDPLKAAREKAQHLKNTQLEMQNQKQQRQRDEERKTQNRKKRARKMMERTRKGQPLMKNVIGDLLGKIKSEVGADVDGH
jgi:hypothetical protein